MHVGGLAPMAARNLVPCAEEAAAEATSAQELTRIVVERSELGRKRIHETPAQHAARVAFLRKVLAQVTLEENGDVDAMRRRIPRIEVLAAAFHAKHAMGATYGSALMEEIEKYEAAPSPRPEALVQTQLTNVAVTARRLLI